MNSIKTRSQIVMESYLSMRVPEIHRLGIKNYLSPRPQTGKGASWMGRKEKTNKNN
jgi:hypothetical protein